MKIVDWQVSQQTIFEKQKVVMCEHVYSLHHQGNLSFVDTMQLIFRAVFLGDEFQ